MSTIACCTSFTWGYLARALVLSRTLRAVHPEWQQTALVVDAPAAGADAALAAFDRVVFAADLGVPAFPAFLFRHNLVEACTALKPRLLAGLLDAGADGAIYLDPDIAVFHPLATVLRALEQAAIVLTPHQHVPNDDEQAIRDGERTAQLYGVFNLGFVAIRNDTTGRAFARWWQGRCESDCRDAPAEGLFTDQRYCDLVPALFPDVAVLRDPGCNVASWNLSRRRLSSDAEGRLAVEGSPLGFYHFTKIGGVGDVMTRRYAQNTLPLELATWWRREVAAAGVPGLGDRPWAWDSFADGTPIPPGLRHAWREEPALRARFADPFAAGPGSLAAWAAAERADLFAPPQGA
ncbi:MAG: hypothetical protein KGK10_13345 [Rhodospirillales bacterium]|nr:hypothetical protein [Rhodospirillales bacterium]